MHPHANYGKEVLEMFSTLQSSIKQSGGCVHTIEMLRNMTAEELILGLAPNGVRFCYEKSLRTPQHQFENFVGKTLQTKKS